MYNELCHNESLVEAENVGNDLANWLINNKIIECIFGPNLHVEVSFFFSPCKAFNFCLFEYNKHLIFSHLDHQISVSILGNKKLHWRKNYMHIVVKIFLLKCWLNKWGRKTVLEEILFWWLPQLSKSCKSWLCSDN